MEYNIKEIEKLKERNLHTHTNYLKKIKKETNSLYNNISKLDSFEHVAVYWKEEVRHEIVHISEKKLLTVVTL